jgi:glyoxylase-like metal-dependent hydrolase (beta-lactamase superfamily II)
MKIEQIYTGCLAQGAYYISSNGEAAIIDPLREVQPYIEKAKKDNSEIKYIFETHFHADFVSGHIDLAEKTGAEMFTARRLRLSLSAELPQTVKFSALAISPSQLFILQVIQWNQLYICLKIAKAHCTLFLPVIHYSLVMLAGLILLKKRLI